MLTYKIKDGLVTESDGEQGEELLQMFTLNKLLFLPTQHRIPHLPGSVHLFSSGCEYKRWVDPWIWREFTWKSLFPLATPLCLSASSLVTNSEERGIFSWELRGGKDDRMDGNVWLLIFVLWTHPYITQVPVAHSTHDDSRSVRHALHCEWRKNFVRITSVFSSVAN